MDLIPKIESTVLIDLREQAKGNSKTKLSAKSDYVPLS